ncbi:Putative peroxiredoxin bcp [Planctomycetes bacterium Pla86]|uniref:Peroxiredoxin bcp n=1 Tax=Engelhardtia mirabilis TaxID=2528011 RepID=A0A518BKV5_9BACT|nr:Putative peroxiredoxin bcp [Planctomycetes bacterium Pla133]QDV01922.1 Putative peroxiredoxin bcp [Planctomycetes bacterium Pla86]
MDLRRWLGVGRTAARRLMKSEGPTMPTIGAPAPEFDLPTHSGQRMRLADLRGKRVVLWFYPKADTPG